MIKFPMVDIIKVDHSGNRLNGFDICCFEIHPINGTKIDSIKSGVRRNHVDSGIFFTGFHLDYADNNGLISRIIANFKFHSVIAVRYLDTGCGNHTVCKIGLNLNTININLSGCSVQTGNIIDLYFVLICIQKEILIFNCSRKIKNIICSGNYITLNESGSAIKIDFIKNGIFSIVNRLGIVNGKVINVVCVVTIDRTVFRPQHVIGSLVENKCKEEFTLFTGHTIFRIFVILLCSLQSNFFEITDIHRKIMPSRFVNVVIHIFGLHDTNDIFCIEYTVTIGVCHIVHLYPTLNVILRHVEPEAHSACIFKCNSFTINTKSEPCILFCMRILRGQTIGFKAHRIITIMNFAVGSVCQGQIQIVIPMRSIFSVVDNIPNINVSLTTLKSPEDFRGLAKVEIYSCCGICTHIQGSSNRTGNICRCTCFIDSNEIQAIKASNRRIGGREGHVVITETDFLNDIVHGSQCLDRNPGGLSKRNGNDRLRKSQCVRSNNGDCLFADNLAFIDHLNGSLTLSTIRFEYTIGNRTHVGFLDLPFYIIRNIKLRTNGIKTESAEAYRAAGSIVFVIRLNLCTCKRTVCRSSCNNKDRAGGRSLTAIRKRTVNLQILTGTLRTERSRSTTITVSSNNTAHFDHVICHLISGKAG